MLARQGSSSEKISTLKSATRYSAVPTLSIIIVSYNVRAFLDKCLDSVYRAIEEIDAEVIVVDNASNDQSVELVNLRFPETHVIANQDNVGFARANNQALRIARGEYTLVLNPDTLVAEDAFQSCLTFLGDHPNVAAVGVTLIDGSGTYLPESKRGLPGPSAAFFKLTGINRIFPNSTYFNHYYLGSLDPAGGTPQEIEVLTGAFLFARKSVLEKVGYFDEAYFMYGEDIDLCYRILQAGHKIYYLPETNIIHFKGESTKRDSARYVNMFYKAMLTFVDKHQSGTHRVMYRQIIKAGIMMRKTLSNLRRVIQVAWPILIDALLVIGTIFTISKLWAINYFHDPSHFDDKFLSVNLPMYTVTWLFALFLFGAYDKGRSVRRVILGLMAGAIVVLIGYGLLSAEYRSSRAVILLALMALLVLIPTWTSMEKRFARRLEFETAKPSAIAIAATRTEMERLLGILNRSSAEAAVQGRIAVPEETDPSNSLGELKQIESIVRQHNLAEIVFSAVDISYRNIIATMMRVGNTLRYRIASAGSDEIIGSASKVSRGDAYTRSIDFRIALPLHRRNKRALDIVVAVLCIVLFPMVRLSKNGKMLTHHAFSVLKGAMTWVGYRTEDSRLNTLPQVRSSVLQIRNIVSSEQEGPHIANHIYAREYSVLRDIDCILRILFDQ